MLLKGFDPIRPQCQKAQLDSRNKHIYSLVRRRDLVPIANFLIHDYCMGGIFFLSYSLF